MLYKTLAIEENMPLAPLTTFQVGGPARYFARIRTEEDAKTALLFSKENSLPLFVLGKGSNIVISDQGFSGMVILNNIDGIKIEQDGNGVLMHAGSGELWDDLVQTSVEKNYAGIECLSGIPGTVGGAVVQNIGAYGQSAHETVAEVRVLEIETGAVKTFSNQDCLFGYRTSFFKSSGADKYIILGASFRLQPNGAPPLNYHDIKNRFSGIQTQPSLREVRNAVIDIRAKKGFVLLPGHQQYQSAGSFFKNSVVSRTVFEAAYQKIAQEKNQGGCKDPWFWNLPSGEVKLSAACLIERAGFAKGYRSGNVGLSPHHPLAIINCGGASAGEIVNLAGEIQKRVLKTYNVFLEPEVLFVGFPKYPFLG